MKKALSLFFSLLMVLSAVSVLPFSANAANTYQISTYAELKAFASAVNGGETDACAILTADVTAEGTDWTPIGNDSKLYVGAFDGDGHTITGLSTEGNGDLNYVGLFGHVGSGGVVRNVGLVGGSIKGKSCVGAVAGWNEGNIINCYNTGDITSTANNAYVGGIAGYLSASQGTARITNCYNTGTVTGNGRYSNVGGIAGYANNTRGTGVTVRIANCYNTGAVTATGTSSRAGGIAASSCDFSGGTVEVINCYSAGAVTADQNVGGVIGLKYDSVVRNCYYDSDVCGLSSAIGKIDDTDDVKGLHTDEMTGTDALTQMPFSDPSAWLVKGTTNLYEFYPHLKGFDFNADGSQKEASAIDAADWPAKIAHSHTYGEPVWSWEADHSSAAAAFTCSGCGDEQTVTDDTPTFENGQFTATVEFLNNPYSDTVSWRTGDLITFGGYPQTQVTDQDMKDALGEKLADDKWHSYGYYTGTGVSDGQMQPGDWMRWQDVLLNGERYRAVTFDDYRPNDTSEPSSAANSCQDENGFESGKTYYFKFEPLQWRVLDPASGLVLCESIIDAQAYQNVSYKNGTAYYQGIDSDVYANDYTTGSIRNWLLNGFYNTAFSAAEQDLIAFVSPDDSSPATDKIFILSTEDALNPAYGFSSVDNEQDPARAAQGTAYAKCQGLLKYNNGKSAWWLRTPGINSINTKAIMHNGALGYALPVYSFIGVRPAFRFASELTASSNSNGYCEPGEPEETELTPATCGVDGEKKIVVKCIFHGETLSETTEPIPATGNHTYGDTGDDRFTCTGCGHVDDERKAAAELADAKAAAKAAEAKIAAIGTVKYDNASKQKIDEARKAYNALTADQKALVKNYKTLTAAEKKYADLKAEADKPVGQTGRPHGENCVCYDITGDSLAANVMRFICAFLCFVLAMRTALGV